MSTAETPGGSATRRQIGPAGTFMRALTAAALLGRVARRGVKPRDVAIGLGVVPAAVLVGVRLRMRSSRSGPLRATGAGGHAANLALIGAFFSAAPSAASVFYGSSLLVAAARGYAACELFAISNLLLDRDDQLGCPVFYPVDALERREPASAAG